jgi:hypothetical protein
MLLPWLFLKKIFVLLLSRASLLVRSGISLLMGRSLLISLARGTGARVPDPNRRVIAVLITIAR